MNEKEFNERAGKILGVKSGKVTRADVFIDCNKHLANGVILWINPSKQQAKKIGELALEYSNVVPITNKETR